MNQPNYGPPLKGLRCSECKHAVYETPSGITCKEGHGCMDEEGEPTATFDTARYYAASDDEESLIHECPEEALQEWLGGFWVEAEGDNIEQEIRTKCPVLINAYSPDIPGERQIKSWSDQLAEQFLDLFQEDFGDPDSCNGTPDHLTFAHFKMAVETGVQETHCWRCKIVATRLFEFDEVIKIAKEDYPEWFEKDEDA